MHGRFDEVDGTIKYDAANPSASKVSVSIQAGSVNTNHAKRDAHLKSPDFFNAGEFPEITFVSTKVAPGTDGSAKVTGDLTMNGVTKSVTLDARVVKVGNHPLNNKPIAAWSARGMVKRSPSPHTLIIWSAVATTACTRWEDSTNSPRRNSTVIASDRCCI